MNGVQLRLCPACGSIFGVNITIRQRQFGKIACNRCGHTALIGDFSREMD